VAAFKTIPENEKLRVVLVGCGGMAQGWVERTLKRGLEMAGLVDIRREAAEALAAKHNLPKSVVFDTLAKAIRKTKPHAVFDITVPAAHYPITLKALKSGCHVLGEKPLSDSMPHARAMCAAAEKAERLYMVTQNRRYLNQVVASSNVICGGGIGELSSVDADFFIGAHFGGFRDLMDNVLLVDMAIHTFDQARKMSGCDPVAVYCHEYNPHGSWYKGNAAAICVFEMTNGVVFTYRGSWASEGLNTSWEAVWRAVGSKGTLIWDGAGAPKAQVVNGTEGFFRPLKDLEVPAVNLAQNGHEGVLEEFIHALHTGETPQTECRDNIKSLAMCLGAVESAKKHRRIEIKI
jgi:predicted dehydrogenase